MSDDENLRQANEVLEDYPKPNSMIDNGNLFYAAVEYQKAYRRQQKKLNAAEAKLHVANAALKFYKGLPLSQEDQKWTQELADQCIDVATEALERTKHET